MNDSTDEEKTEIKIGERGVHTTITLSRENFYFLVACCGYFRQDLTTPRKLQHRLPLEGP